MKTDYLKEELFRKVLEAHKKNTQYRFNIELDDTGFCLTVFAHHTPYNITGKYVMAEYESFLQNDPMAEEKALNFAIAELSYFLKYPELKTGIRLAMYQEMHRKCKALAKDDRWIADYLNLDAEIVKGLSV